MKKTTAFLLMIILALFIFRYTPKVKAFSYTLERQWNYAPTGSHALRDEHPSDDSYSSTHGFTWTTNDSYTLGYVDFYLKKSGSPTSDINAVLYATSGGSPTGNPLVWSDNAINGASITTAWVWYTFNFTASAYSISDSTTYFIGVQVNTSNVDSSNYVMHGITTQTTVDYARYKYATGAWTVLSGTYDCPFKLYSLDVVVYSYITFLHTDGGTFRRDNADLANNTESQYVNGTNVSFEMTALINGNNTYTFSNWTHGATTNISNPYDFDITITGNLTLWCYYENASAGAATVGVAKLFTGLVFLGVFIGLPLILVLRKKDLI